MLRSLKLGVTAAVVGLVSASTLIGPDPAVASPGAAPEITIVTPKCVGVGETITLHTYVSVGDLATHLAFGDIYFDQDSTVETHYGDGAQYAEQDVTVAGRRSGEYEVDATVTDSDGNQSYEEQEFVTVQQGCDAGTDNPVRFDPPTSAARVTVASTHAVAGARYRLAAKVYDAEAVGTSAGTLTWQSRLVGSSAWRSAGTSAVRSGPFTSTSPAFTSTRKTYYRAEYTPAASCSCRASSQSASAVVSIAPKIARSVSIGATRTYVRATVVPRVGRLTLHLQLDTDGGWKTLASAKTGSTGSVRLSLGRPSRGGTYRVESAANASYLSGSSAHFGLRARKPLTRIMWDCAHFKYRPATVDTCGDGTVYFTRIRYRTYTDKVATGRLRLHLNDCRPDCAEGHYHAYAATFRFYDVKTARHVPSFTRAAVRYGRHHFTIALGYLV